MLMGWWETNAIWNLRVALDFPWLSQVSQYIAIRCNTDTHIIPILLLLLLLLILQCITAMYCNYTCIQCIFNIRTFTYFYTYHNKKSHVYIFLAWLSFSLWLDSWRWRWRENLVFFPPHTTTSTTSAKRGPAEALHLERALHPTRAEREPSNSGHWPWRLPCFNLLQIGFLTTYCVMCCVSML